MIRRANRVQQILFARIRVLEGYVSNLPAGLKNLSNQAHFSSNGFFPNQSYTPISHLRRSYPLASGATFQNSTRPGPRLARHNSQAFAS